MTDGFNDQLRNNVGPNLARRLDATWYWTKVVILNNLLNGSPEFPYYEPLVYSRWFFFGGAALAIAGGIIADYLSLLLMQPNRFPQSVVSVTAILMGALLAPLVILFFAVFIKGAKDERFKPFIQRPQAHELLSTAISRRVPEERLKLAEQALLLYPKDIRCHVFIAGLYEEHFHEPEKAKQRYMVARAAIERAIALKERTGRSPTREHALRADLQGNLTRLST